LQANYLTTSTKVQSICCCKSRHQEKVQACRSSWQKTNGGNNDQDGIGDVAVEHIEDESEKQEEHDEEHDELDD